MAMVLLAVLLAGCDGFYSDYAFSETPAWDAAATQGLVPELVTPQVEVTPNRTPDLDAQQAQAAATLAAINQQMTATSQAAQMTQQAAAFEATQAADAALATSTAQAWAITATYEAAQATQAAQVQGTAQSLVVLATQQALGATATQQVIDLERAELTNQAWAVVPLVLVALLGAVVLGLGAWAVVEIVKAARNRQAVVQLPNGGALVVTERRLAVLKTDVMLAPERQMGADANEPASEQARLTLALAQQQTEIQRSYAAAGAKPRGGSERTGGSQAEAPEWSVNIPTVAVWPPVVRDGIALGVGAQGPVVAQADIDPHLMVAGTTGSGKTRYMLRPVVAQALAAGWAVVVVDRSGLDFAVFAEHINCNMVTLGGNPEDAIGILQAAYSQVLNRMRQMAAAGVSTWGQMPSGSGPRVLMVLDEFSNLADALDNRGRDDLWRAARMLAAEARKTGVHLAIALQDPTAQSIDLRIRRNMGAVAFRVRDGAASRVVINQDGAERLQTRQFVAVVGNQVQAGLAYAPSDDELLRYLDEHPTQQMQMLDLTVQTALPGLDHEIVRIAEQIRSAWERGESKRQMARMLGQTYGGGFANKLDQAIEYLATTTTSRRIAGDAE
jgi:hypothetical protein